MSSQYDENLLTSVPEATKAQLQSGYNPDILVENNTSSTPATPAVDPEVADQPLIPVRQSQDALPLTKTKKVPFYATTKGIIGIVILVAIIIAAVVGGAVGGTRKKRTSSASAGAISGVNGQGAATIAGSGVSYISTVRVTSPAPTSTSEAGNGASPTPTPTPTPTPANGNSQGVGST